MGLEGGGLGIDWGLTQNVDHNGLGIDLGLSQKVDQNGRVGRGGEVQERVTCGGARECGWIEGYGGRVVEVLEAQKG